MTEPRRPMRMAAAAVALALALAVGACSADAEPEVVQAPAPDSLAFDVAGMSPDAALQSVLADLGTSYRFSSKLRTEAGDQVFVDGYRVGSGVQYTLTIGAAAVDTISVDGQTWVRQAGKKKWRASEAGTDPDPLAALATPISIEAAASGGYVAVYDAVAIDMGSEGTVEVRISIEGAAASFAATGAGNLAMLTTLTADGGLAPVVAPV